MTDERKTLEKMLAKLRDEESRRHLWSIKNDPKVFRQHLVIDAGGEEKRLGDVLEPWQDQDFRATDPAWALIAGLPFCGGYVPKYAYLERGRGHTKTTDIAIQVLWTLLASRLKIRGIVCAGSEEQAGFVREAIDTLLRLNPWLSRHIKANKKSVNNLGTGSFLKVLATDEMNKMGETPDFIVVDELTHWKNRQFWETIFSSVPKRPRCFLVIISNAGLEKGDSWQWKVREMMRQSPRCYFHRLDGPVASWIGAETLAEQREGMTQEAFARLWLNEWQEGHGEGLNHEDIAKAITQDGPRMDRGANHVVFLSADLGIYRDHAAVCVVGLDLTTRRKVILNMRRWIPEECDDGKVSLAEVESYILWARKTYDCNDIVLDPKEAEYLMQRLESAGMHCVRWVYTPENCTKMAMALLQSFRDRKIDLYNDAKLLADLRALRFVETGSYTKLDASRLSDGSHADMGFALAQALPPADEVLANYAQDAA